ncbi:probable pectinesterase/pectinesterase inhibitor 21 [Tanacetum coccineum]
MHGISSELRKSLSPWDVGRDVGLGDVAGRLGLVLLGPDIPPSVLSPSSEAMKIPSKGMKILTKLEKKFSVPIDFWTIPLQRIMYLLMSLAVSDAKSVPMFAQKFSKQRTLVELEHVTNREALLYMKFMPKAPIRRELCLKLIVADGSEKSYMIGGLVLHNCTVKMDIDLETDIDKERYEIYLGRPWMPAAKMAVIGSDLGGFLNPE